MNSISKKIKRSLALVLSFVMVVSVLTAVPTTTTEAAAKKIVKSLSVSKSKVTLTAGKSTTLKATVKASKKVAKSDLKVTVKSNKTSVATVKITKNPTKKATSGATSFKVTAKKAGTAKITVTAKNKSTKGKTVKKTVTVTVKAKPAATTQATTTEVPVTTEDPNALKGIVVTPATLDIVEKGTDKITVAADPATAVLPTPVFATKNAAVATVANDGTVTAVSAGTAEITVTVGEFTKSVTVTVKAAVDGKITLDPKQLNLYVGETKVIKSQKEGDAIKDMEIVWTSSDEKVATVDKDGNVKAIAKGNAVITATVGNTSVVDTCNVEVRDDAPGIATFKATKANTLTVVLSHDVNKDDQAKVKFDLKMGQDEQKVDGAWVDAHTYTLTKNTDYKVGKYTVTMSAEGLTLNSSAVVATAEVVENNAAKIVADTSTLGAGNGGTNAATNQLTEAGTFKYQVLDIYGEAMKVTDPGIVKWVVTSTDGTNVITLGDITADTVTFKSSKALAADEKIRVNGYLIADMAVNTGIVEIPVAPLYINSLTFTGVVNAKGEKVEMKWNASPVTYYLTYKAVDNFGKDVDLKTYKYSNAAQFIQTITSSDTTKMSTPTFEQVDEKYTGRITATVAGGKSGSVTVTAMGYDYKPTSYEFKIADKPVPTTINIGGDKDYDVVAGENVEIPVTFKDQYGDDIKVLTRDFATYFTANLYDVQGGDLVSSISANPKTVYTTGKITVKTTDLAKAGKINLVVTKANDITKSTTYTIPVKAGRTPAQVLLKNGDIFKSVLVNQEKNVKFTVCDDYNKEVTRAMMGTKTAAGAKVGDVKYRVKVSVTGDNVYIKNGSGATAKTDLILDAETSAEEIATDGTFSLYVKGASVSTADNKITVALQKVTCATNDEWPTDWKTVSSTDYNVSVTNELRDISIESNAKEYKSGEDVILTFTALDNTIAANGKAISDYNQTVNAIITETVDGTVTQFTAALKFENGVAKHTVEATTATDAIHKATYAIKAGAVIPTGTVDPSGSVGDIVIKANVLKKIDVSYADGTLTLTLKDCNGNTLNYFTPNSPYVKIETKNADTGDKDVAEVFTNKVDKNNNLLDVAGTTDGSGELTFTVNDTSIDAGDKITVTIDGVSGTFTK